MPTTASNRTRTQGHRQRRERQDGHSGQDDHGQQEPGRRIEARQLPADHPASTRRTPATPPAIRHQDRHQAEQLPGTAWRTAGPAPGETTRAEDHPAALLFAGHRHDLGDGHGHPGGHDYPGSDPRRRQPAAGPGTAQRTGPGHRATAKKETGRTTTATPTTRTTRSPAAGSRPRTCRRITRPALGGAAAGHHLADSRPGARWDHPGRGSPAPLLFANDQHDQGDHGHREPGSDPHGRQPAGPRRRRPAAGPGTAQ